MSDRLASGSYLDFSRCQMPAIQEEWLMEKFKELSDLLTVTWGE